MSSMFKVFWRVPTLWTEHFVYFIPVLQKQKPKRVKAIYNCVADNPDELTFSEGEVIVVDGEEDQEWWVSVSEFDLHNAFPAHTSPVCSSGRVCRRAVSP